MNRKIFISFLHILIFFLSATAQQSNHITQAETPLYHGNLLTKEHLLYRSEEELWLEIYDLRSQINDIKALLYKEGYVYYHLEEPTVSTWLDGGRHTLGVAFSDDGVLLAHASTSSNSYKPNTLSISKMTGNGTPAASKSFDQAIVPSSEYLTELSWRPTQVGDLYYLTVLSDEPSLSTTNYIKLYTFHATDVTTHIADLPYTSTVLTGRIKRLAWSRLGAIHLAIAGYTASNTLALQIFQVSHDNPTNKFLSKTSVTLDSCTAGNRYGISGLSWNSENMLAVSYYEENGSIIVKRKLKLFSFDGNSTLTEKKVVDLDAKTSLERVHTIKWSPNNLYLGVLLDSGYISIYHYDKIANTFTLQATSEYFHDAVGFDWSSDSRYLVVPHTTYKPVISFLQFDIERKQARRLITRFQRLINGAISVAWSKPFNDHTMLIFGSIGWGTELSGYQHDENTTYLDILKHDQVLDENSIYDNEEKLYTIDQDLKKTRNLIVDNYVLADLENPRKKLNFSTYNGFPWGAAWNNNTYVMGQDNMLRFFMPEQYSLSTTPFEEFTIPSISPVNGTSKAFEWNPKYQNIFALFYYGTFRIYSFDPTQSTGNRVTLLTHSANMKLFSQDEGKWAIAWSPDGNYIAYVNAIAEMYQDNILFDDYRAILTLTIARFDHQTHTLTPQATYFLGHDYYTEDFIPTTGRDIVQMDYEPRIVWNPSQQIIVSTKIKNLNDTYTSLTSFFDFDPQSSSLQQTQIDTTYYPCIRWSPDGKYVIFCSIDNKTYDPLSSFKIYSYQKETKTLSFLTEYIVPTIYTIEWDPYGNYIAVVHNDENEKVSIYSFNPQGENIIIPIHTSFIPSYDNKTYGGYTLLGWSPIINSKSYMIFTKRWHEMLQTKYSVSIGWSLDAIERTLTNEMSDRAIEVATGSSLFNFKTTTNFNGNNKTYVFSNADEKLINVSPDQTVTLKNIILQNFNFNTINLENNASIFFDDKTSIALDGKQYEINRTYTFKGNCIINGNNSTIIFGPYAGFFVDQNSSLLLQNITIKGLSDEQIKCMDTTSTVSINGTVNFFMDGNYYFKNGHLALTPASQLNISNEYDFVYQSPSSSIIGSAAVWQMTRDATFFYNPESDDRDLIQFAKQDGIFALKGASLVSSTTGIRLTRGTFKISGENNYIYSSGRTLSDSIMLGNSSFEENLTCRFDGSTFNIINGRVVWANVEE